jgi:hypothetical protein
MKHSRTDNNPYLLIEGTDQPQRDSETGEPIPNPNFGVVTEIGEDDPPPEPNNPGNPYFPGWKPKTQLGFWGLVQGVFIALGGSNEAGADRFARLIGDRRTLGIDKMIAATGLVDPDDENGAFLKALKFLTTTNAASDGQVLMTDAEVAAIMRQSNWT